MYVRKHEIKTLPELTPKRDEILLSLMEQAMQGNLPIYFAAVPTALIVPFDMDYRPDLHPTGKAAIKDSFEKGKQKIFQKLLVYPRGVWFVVSDDYIPLFAALNGLPDYVPCFVLGKPDNPYLTDVQGPIKQEDVGRVLGVQ